MVTIIIDLAVVSYNRIRCLAVYGTIWCPLWMCNRIWRPTVPCAIIQWLTLLISCQCIGECTMGWPQVLGVCGLCPMRE